LNKSDLARILAQKEDFKGDEARRVINLIFDGFSEELIRGRRIEVRGLGTFKVRDYPSYEGRNPKSGEPIIVKPKKLPVFKVSKNLHERLNVKTKKAKGKKNVRS
jgi:integration host factor subunit beta